MDKQEYRLSDEDHQRWREARKYEEVLAFWKAMGIKYGFDANRCEIHLKKGMPWVMGVKK